ncbi:hypothetical protein DH2020_043262 [Rehmannia glutinosa]|uniref:Cystatin domain-containing protein n=1 Tax=Rehmannia glutinosa TaxID=99300 RepID=A0ABR0ULG9_REHGL
MDDLETKNPKVSIHSILAIPIPNEARRDGFIGGWKPIEDLEDPTVVMVAKFAITEPNKWANTNLQYVTVVSGKTMMVAGPLFRLVISAKNNGSTNPKNYLAVVWKRVGRVEGNPLKTPIIQKIRG